MAIEVTVPNLPESVADATVIAWHKKTGERIGRDENLADLETDKVVLEVPSPIEGVVGEIFKEIGTTVAAGDVLAILEPLGEGGKAAQESSIPAAAETGNSTLPTGQAGSGDETPVLSPSVRRLVMEHQVEVAALKGTGKGGRITKEDVERYLSVQENKPSPTAQPQPEPPGEKIRPASTSRPPRVEPDQEGRPERRVPMTRIRARIAERLLQAQQNAAILTTFNEVNLKRVMELRRRYRDSFEHKHGIRLGFMSFFVKACVEALQQFPIVNASVDGQDIIYHGYFDIGIAVSSPRGLVVPILRDADRLEFAQIEKSIHEFGEKAEMGTLSIEELSGGTFSISNGGVFGSMLSTPILNPPQSAILGMHAIQDRATVEKGQIVIRPMMYLALSYDHRVIDGADAVRCLVAIKEGLEDPARLLIGL
jgi:2-oxoglutarate dehydrogenase E2 component (dihydrolipoamide succinyltransferase)